MGDLGCGVSRALSPGLRAAGPGPGALGARRIGEEAAPGGLPEPLTSAWVRGPSGANLGDFGEGGCGGMYALTTPAIGCQFTFF